MPLPGPAAAGTIPRGIDTLWEASIVFFMEPARTNFDLSWRMFGIDVRVHPMFWLMSALLGWPQVDLGFSYLLVWIGCVFVSILVHELGHVIAGRLFGSDGEIVLYGFGGLAIGSSDVPRRWQRNLVYFAGPFAGFVLLGVVLAVLLVTLPPGPALLRQDFLRGLMVRMGRAEWSLLVAMAVIDLVQINLFWGLLNLLPVWPLDGGRISRETMEWCSPQRGAAIAFFVSGAVAGLLAANALAGYLGRPFLPYVPAGGLYMAFFFGMMALSSFQLYQIEAQRGRRRGGLAPWAREEADDDYRSHWNR
jgi:Zn-dependent protease